MGGYTETPNFLFALLPNMKEAELKVVMAVARKTAGWHLDCVKLRMADFEELTGLSRPSVNTGIKIAIERGILGRTEDGESFIYWLIEPIEEDMAVKNFNHQDKTETQEAPDSKNSLPSAVNNFNHETVKNFNPIKRNINTNKPKKKRESARASQPTISSGVKGAQTIKINSPYLKGSTFVNGYIPIGAGRNAVEVYYERFKITLNEHRLSDPLEEDLVRNCPDLVLLREVVAAYERAGYKRTRNIDLILDWYRDPMRFRSKHNGNHNGNNQADYRRPETSQHTMEEHRAHDAANRAAGRPF